MKDLQENSLKLNHLVLVMGGAIRLMNRNGAQCAVLLERSKSAMANNAVFEAWLVR